MANRRTIIFVLNPQLSKTANASLCDVTGIIASIQLFFDKRERVTNQLNLSYSHFLIKISIFYFHTKFWAEALILLRDIQVKTSQNCIHTNVIDRLVLLIYKKYHFRHLFPFTKEGQCSILMRHDFQGNIESRWSLGKILYRYWPGRGHEISRFGGLPRELYFPKG